MFLFPFSAYEPDLELSQVMAAVSDMTDAEYTDWIAAGQPDVYIFLALRNVCAVHSVTPTCNCVADLDCGETADIEVSCMTHNYSRMELE